MTESIHIGGEMRPVRFGLAALLKYEQETGRIALDDFFEISRGKVSVIVMVDLVYYGLIGGHEKTKTEVTFDKDDVADWMTADNTIFERCMVAFAKAFPQLGNVKAAPQTKPTVPQAKLPAPQA